MNYKGTKDFNHKSLPAIGVLFANLGTPDAPTSRAVRPYLREFLSDNRVIELPRLLWWFLLNFVVLVKRPRASARLYAKIWTEQGSPLLITSLEQGKLLEAALQERIGEPVHVAVGMRYGKNSIAEALEQLREKGVQKILLLSAYPQYSGTSSASVFDAASDELKTWRWIPDVRWVSTFHDHPGYIAALAASITEHWKRQGRAEKLLFSFHGIPTRYFENGDPYYCFCQKTARLVAEQLSLSTGQYTVAFQSIFGKEEWIKPATDKTLKGFAEGGMSSVDVICPGFSADCLETLEEIDKENRKIFLEHGGKDFRYIEAFNVRPDFISALADLAMEHMAGWYTLKGVWDGGEVEREVGRVAERASSKRGTY